MVKLAVFGIFLLVLVFQPVMLLAAEGDPVVSVGLVEKVIVLAGLVSATVQAVKKLLPNLVHGNVAVALAVIGAAAASFASADPSALFSAAFFTELVWTILGALGIHGLAKTAAGG